MTSESIQKKFPVMTTPRKSGAFIFWDMIEPHREQAHRNHGQTLERLAEHGGLGPEELVAVLEDREYRSMDYVEAEICLADCITEFVSKQRFLDIVRSEIELIKGWNSHVEFSSQEIGMINDINKGINIPK